MRRWLGLLLIVLPFSAEAAAFVDATGRTLALPEAPARVLPAGPPAAVLLLALAPDLMLGWPHHPDEPAAAWLPDAAAELPEVPHLTGKADVTGAIAALHPDLIVDYGDTTPRYAKIDTETQARTGVPTVLLDGSLRHVPQALRDLGTILHRAPRAALLAQLAEAMLAAVPPAASRPRVVYARGADGLSLAMPGSLPAQVFDVLGWTIVAPPRTEGGGAFVHASVAAIAALDPDVLIFGNPQAAGSAATTPEWRALRAMREGHARQAPNLPFGWIEEPPSINRLLGVAWLSGAEPGVLGAMFGATVYGRAPDAGQLAALRHSAAPIAP